VPSTISGKRRRHLGAATQAQLYPACVDGEQSPVPVPFRFRGPPRSQVRPGCGGGQYGLGNVQVTRHVFHVRWPTGPTAPVCAVPALARGGADRVASGAYWAGAGEAGAPVGCLDHPRLAELEAGGRERFRRASRRSGWGRGGRPCR
jgi:hypothetical protein